MPPESMIVVVVDRVIVSTLAAGGGSDVPDFSSPNEAHTNHSHEPNNNKRQ